MPKKKKVILAYSGGLDTSVAIRWLMDKGMDVVCYMADVGQGEDTSDAYKRALKIGASKCIVDDLKKQFIKDYVFPSLKSGALYQGKYNMATSLSRPIIAGAMVKAAKKEKAVFLSHGCTGKGNDQVRFEVSFNIIAPELKVIAPVREWELKTRDAEIKYAKEKGIPINQTRKKSFSIDKNLWGVSVEGGYLEDTSNEPGPDTFVSVNTVESTPDKPGYLTLGFEKGIPVSLNGRKYKDHVTLIVKLNDMGAKHGIGRVDMVEDRLVGIKSREIYEAPASAILHEAHNSLEEMVLDRETMRFKRVVADKYSELVYNGLWFTPLREALDVFIDKTQQKVTGIVKVKLFKGKVLSVSRESRFSRYNKSLATYGEGDIFDQSMAKGFIELWGLPYKK